MGSKWSKLKKYVEKGEQAKVLELYHNSSDIRRKLNANSVADERTLDTYLHLCCQHGMSEFLKLLLYENKGNPNKLNSLKQNALHKVCQGSNDQQQYECLQLILQWHDTSATSTTGASPTTATGTTPHQVATTTTTTTNNNNNATTCGDIPLVTYNSPVDKRSHTRIIDEAFTSAARQNQNLLIEVNLNAKDHFDNTPLHYAAMANLPICIQTLISHGAYLFVENGDHLTACDIAESAGQKDIALYLESRMLFSKDEDEKDNIDDLKHDICLDDEQKFGLRLQDLQEEKDKLVVETADMLRCNLLTAEILLKKHAWSKESLLNAWLNDPVKCCKSCGLSPAIIEQHQQQPMADIIASEAKSDEQRFKLKSVSFDNSTTTGQQRVGQRGAPSSTNMTTTQSGTTPASSSSPLANSSAQTTTTASASSAATNNDVIMKCDICLNCSSSSSENNEDETNAAAAATHQLAISDFVQIACEHTFCKTCWEQYLTMKIQEGNVSEIVCPQVNCCATIPRRLVERLVSKEAAAKYLHFDLQAFVHSNPNIKWCPYPGCTMAIRNPRAFTFAAVSSTSLATTAAATATATNQSTAGGKSGDLVLGQNNNNNNNNNLNASPCSSVSKASSVLSNNSSSSVAAAAAASAAAAAKEAFYSPSDHSRSVDCGMGHYSCWDCLKEGHEPASCQNWSDWYQKIMEIKPEEMSNTNEEEELTANYLWLVTNSKKCPNFNCNAPIQKNEGCNHVKCYKCKHDFCWICLEPWKKHSSATGGYFQCNRYEASSKLTNKERETVADAEEAHLKAVELNKFVHYYSRFKNHELSYKIEEPLLATAKIKFDALVAQQHQQQQQQLQHQQNQHCQSQQDLVDTVVVANGQEQHTEQQQANGHQSPSLPPFKKQRSSLPNESTSRVADSPPLAAAHSNIRAMSHPANTYMPKNKKQSSSEDEAQQHLLSKSTSMPAQMAVEQQLQQQQQQNQPLAADDDPVSQSEESSSNNNKNSADAHVFIEDAIKELLKSRRILRCSYVYGYFLDTFGHKKFIFEYIQTEFEEFTENLSQIIARPYLKTPKNTIIRLTCILKKKRLDFLDTITRGLNSFNDTPPALRRYSRQRWKYLLKDNIQNEDEFKNTIAMSLKELNPRNPWIVDKKGRHTNLLAFLNDWPELEYDLDSILVPSKERKELCALRGCDKLRAVNTLSGSLFNYCSIKCLRKDYDAYVQRQKKNATSMNNTKTKWLIQDASVTSRMLAEMAECETGSAVADTATVAAAQTAHSQSSNNDSKHLANGLSAQSSDDNNNNNTNNKPTITLSSSSTSNGKQQHVDVNDDVEIVIDCV